MKGKYRYLLTFLIALLTNFNLTAQERPFPYPEIPDLLQDPQDRIAYLLENFWNNFNFNDTTEENKVTEEQGFVDFINFLQYADSALAAKSTCILAEKIGKTKECQQRFDGLIDHYLGNPDSPMRNDRTYAHLLRALPPTPRRNFLLKEVTKNLPGMRSANISFVADYGQNIRATQQPQRLYDVKSPMTLLVFHDPDCEHCHEIMPLIQNSQELKMNANRLKILYINIEADYNFAIRKDYYLPALPALYLLDEQKRILLKDATLKQVIEFLQGKVK